MYQLERLTKENPVEGFWKCYHRIRNAGTVINHKKLHRYINKWGYHLDAK
jgi:putative transposase